MTIDIEIILGQYCLYSFAFVILIAYNFLLNLVGIETCTYMYMYVHFGANGCLVFNYDLCAFANFISYNYFQVN